MNSETRLTIAIVIGLLLGVLCGQLLFDPIWHGGMPQSEHANASLISVFEFVGFTVFMGLLKMLIVPLIAASVLTAVTSVGDFRVLGRLGTWTILYYLATMVVAVVLGLCVVTFMQPGLALLDVGGLAPTDAPPAAAVVVAEGGVVGVLKNLVGLMIPSNIFAALAEGKTLSVITFFIFFGVMLTQLGQLGKPIVDFAQAVTAVMMRMVEVVLWLAPLGVFCLLAWTIARTGLGVFSDSIGLYICTVLIGLIIHSVIVLPLVLWTFGRTNPLKFAYQMRAALLMALGTSSSSASLPVTIESATTEGGVSERAAGLVLPLGSTINMDGTALYEAVAVVFMAQASGIELGILQLCLIAVTATLAAVGAAGIPSAGLVTMLIVVDAVNNSLAVSGSELIPVAAIGFIIGVDRILDMVRTTVNVWGDAVGAKLISSIDYRETQSV
jgi:Na+/H+-dicarboxylate symporter